MQGGGSSATTVPRVRATAISLARRRDRWSACEAHLQSILPAQVPLDMFEGCDAKAAIAGASSSATEGTTSPVVRLEQALGCTIYRGWPITEVADVRRCYPDLAEIESDAEVWVQYEKACSRAFRPDRSRLYVGFFMRHLAVGEIGASMSHFRVAERAHAEGLDLQIVFEDDARPTAEAVPALLEEVDALQRRGIAWDLIYLHSANYGRRPEAKVDEEVSELHYAGHRRVCHAYALSASGAAKIATCGYRLSVFPYDDFLSSLHAGHPRPDIMALPCVRQARGEAVSDAEVTEAHAEEDENRESQEDGAIAGAVAPFVGLTFSDERALCTVPQRSAAAGGLLDSDSKVGVGSSVLLGDAGVEHALVIDDEEGGDAQHERSHRGGVQADDHRAFVSSLTPPAIDQCDLHDRAAEVASQLAKYSHARIRVDTAALEILLKAEAAAADFFAGSTAASKTKHVGKGGRLGKLMLWSCGYSAWPEREQWHVVCGAPDAQPWPAGADESPTAGALDERLSLRGALMRAKELLRCIAVDTLACLPRESGQDASTGELADACSAMGAGTDPSVLDAFWYHAGRSAEQTAPNIAACSGGDLAKAALTTDDTSHTADGDVAHWDDMAMSAHKDPGVLTVTRASEVAGLQIEVQGKWIAVEALASSDEVLIFPGEQLEKATGGRVGAAVHRVALSKSRATQRNSVVFELRAPE